MRWPPRPAVLRYRMFRLIAFDADDTLWHNEPLFSDTQDRFRELLRRYHDDAWIEQRLLETETRNLQHYGYGVKAFTLSMIETAIELTEGRVGGAEVEAILGMGREMLLAPVQLLDGVAETVEALAARWDLMVITKGDLLDQETKVARSGLGDLFSHVEVVSRKDRTTYERILRGHAVEPREFVMVGNSLRSDVLPVLETGAHAVHVPYPVTWAHEEVEAERLEGLHFARADDIRELPRVLDGLEGRGDA